MVFDALHADYNLMSVGGLPSLGSAVRSMYSNS